MNCFTLRTSDKKTQKKFEKKGRQIFVHRTTIKGRNIRYLVSRKELDNQPVIFFVHGSPGSSDNFFKYMLNDSLSSSAIMIAPDRPGYGYSGLGNSISDIEKQAEIMLDLMDSLMLEDVFLVGHSFGGTIATKMSMMRPDKINRLMLLAPSLDPEYEKIFWFTKLGKWPPTRLLTPAPLKSATDEKYGFKAGLEEMQSEFSALSMPVVYIHGTKDRIVDFENTNYIKNKVSDDQLTVITVPKANHFLPWNQVSLITNELLNWVNQYSSAN